MDAAFFRFQVGDSVLRTQQTEVKQTEEPASQLNGEDSVVGYFPDHPGDILRIQSSKIRPAPAKVEQVEIPKKKAILPPVWNFNSNFLLENGLTTAINKTGFTGDEETYVSASGARPGRINPQERSLSHLDWFLGIFLIIGLLFVWIRLFYGKYFGVLASAVSSFQLSAKLFRERNIMVRRVSIVLDFIYFVMLSILAFELLTHFKWVTYTISNFNLYMLLLNIIMLYSLIRIALLRITAYLFLKRTLFSEYIHNTLVINKGAGIILFPVVITARYFPYSLISVVLVAGVIILVLGVIWKSIRAYQIIRRKDVVLFYLILYLCTLEFLPLLIGYKVIISLI